MPSVESIKYDLSGDYTIKAVTGKFYRFKKGDKEVFVPEDSMGSVDGFEKGAKNRT